MKLSWLVKFRSFFESKFEFIVSSPGNTLVREVCIFLFLISFPVLSFSQAVFQRTFGGSSDDRSYSAFPASDGGYIITGQFKPDASTPEDQIMVKMNSDASLYWTKTIGGAGNDYIRSSIQTVDGGYAFWGYTTSYGAIGANNMYFIKMNSDGSAMWSKAISSMGGANIEEGYSVIQKTDGSYLLSGHTNGYGAGNYDVFIISLTSDGAGFVTNTFGTGSSDKGRQVITTSDGGFAIAGQNSSVGSGDMYIVKANSDGSAFWGKTFGSAFTDFAYSVVETFDGGFVLAGETGSNSNMYLVKMDSGGGFLWSRSIGGPSSGTEDAKQILETADRGLIIVGSITGGSLGGSDVFLVKTNSNGIVSWAESYGNTGDEFGHSVSICPDGGYLLSGYTNSAGSGNYDLYLIKTNSNGISGCREQAITTTTASITTNVASSGAGASPGGAVLGGGNITTPSITVKNACNNSITLPVEMLEFKWHCENGDPVLRWVTASEMNNNYFSVERSATGNNFEPIGQVYGAGTSSTVHEYIFTDDQPSTPGGEGPERKYYRLRQADFNGQNEYFGPVSVSCDRDEIMIIPSVSGGLFLITGSPGSAEVCVYSALGESVFSGNRLFLTSLIDLTACTSGLYFVKVTTAHGAFIQKVIKQ